MNPARKGPTLSQVAEEAGVSLAAASFVMSGRAGRGSAGSDETKTRVLEAARRLDYVPNQHARAMRKGRSDVIALDLGFIGDPWTASMSDAVQRRAADHDLSTVVLLDDNWFDFLSGYHSAAALLTGVGQSDVDHIRRLVDAGQGVVVYTDGVEPDRFDVIRTSPARAVDGAYRQLRGRHADVALLTHVAPRLTERRNRADMFLDAAAAAGDDPSAARIIPTAWGRRQAYEAARAVLARADRPTAIIGGSAQQALAVQAAAISLGLRLPDDLELVALGDVPDEALLFGPVSYWGVRDVFDRTARILVERATAGPDGTGELHDFTWEFFPGGTTRNGAEA